MSESPWSHYKIGSPVTRLIKRAGDQFALWTSELKQLGLEFEEGDAIPYWNLLTAIYTLTEEEGVRVRATDAYAFGSSNTTAKRKLAALIKAKLVITTENPDRRTEKFVTVSKEVQEAVLRTLDSWAENYEADTAAYRKHRHPS